MKTASTLLTFNACIGCVAQLDDHEDKHTVLHDRTLATLALPNGGTMTFLNTSDTEEDTAITVIEQGVTRSNIRVYFEAYHATPLELYMALMPEEVPPDALYEDHAERTGDVDPRILPGPEDFQSDDTEPLAASQVDTTGLVSCGSSGSAFHTNLASHIASYSHSFASHSHLQDKSGSWTLTASASTEHLMSVCSHSGTVTVNIDEEAFQNVWTNIVSTTASPSSATVYWIDGGFVSQRRRVRVTDASGDDYSIGASWDQTS